MAPLFFPDRARAPQITVRDYLPAIADVGSSPAYTEAELARVDEGHRRLADNVFVRGYALALVPGGARPAGAAPVGRLVRRRGPCVTAQPAVRGATVTVSLRVPPGGMSLQAPGASITLRRFASGYVGATPLSGGATRAVLRIPSDRSARPWYALVANARSLRACGLGR
jgi:hypothetical protein